MRLRDYLGYIDTDGFPLGTNEECYACIENYFRNQHVIQADDGYTVLLSARQARLAARMLLAYNQIPLTFTQKDPLFTDYEIDEIRRNPEAFFRDAGIAERACQELEERCWQKIKDQEKGIHREEGPFPGLRVVYHWSECLMHDREGKKLPMDRDIVLFGEDAYHFLAQLNQLDKEFFAEQLSGYDTCAKAKVDISVPGFTMDGMRIDLGDLEMKNAKSIADALDHRLTMSLKDSLENARMHLMYQHKMENYEHPEPVTEEEVQAYQEAQRASIAVAEEGIQKFRNNEKAYLSKHPELAAINRMDAPLYVYEASEKDLQMALQRGYVSDVLPMLEIPENALPLNSFSRLDYSEAWGLNVLQHMDLDQLDGYARPASPMPSGTRLFRSCVKPSTLAYLEKDSSLPAIHLTPILMPSEVASAQKLQKAVRLEITKQYPGKTQEALPTVYTGMDALDEWCHTCDHDAELYRYAVDTGCAVPGLEATMHIRLTLDGKDIVSGTFRNGDGRIAKVFGGTSYLPALSPEAKDMLKQGMIGRNKYASGSGQHPVFHCNLYFKDQPFPSVEASRENLQERFEKPAFDEDNKRNRDDISRYYEAYACCDPENDTPEKVCQEMTRAMIQDGYTKPQIRAVARGMVHRPRAYKDHIDAFLKTPEVKQLLDASRKEKSTQKEGEPYATNQR